MINVTLENELFQNLCDFTFRPCHKSTVKLDLNQQKNSIAIIIDRNSEKQFSINCCIYKRLALKS